MTTQTMKNTQKTAFMTLSFESSQKEEIKSILFVLYTFSNPSADDRVRAL